jgi:hypothetical protein
VSSPIVHRGYDGRDLVLPDDPTAVLRLHDIPALADQMGHDIVTASGTTLLGADNKAGVAEIMTRGRLSHRSSRDSARDHPARLHAGRGSRARHEAFRRRALRRAIRLHHGRRPPWRDRDGELLRRRDDGHLPRLQHPSGLCERPHGERHQGGRAFIDRLPDDRMSPETTDGHEGSFTPM